MPGPFAKLGGFGWLTGGPAIVPANSIAQSQGASSDLPYADYGYIPGVAQQANSRPTPAPELNPQPYFTTGQLAHANWFTTRVHLSPLGRTSQ